jgi:diamine N-acetyltransferase
MLEIDPDDESARVAALEVCTSWAPGEGSPGPFHERLGFVLTGEVDEDELVARLTL